MSSVRKYKQWNEKFTFICGDFNIDWLKYAEHIKTSEFVIMMFGLGFYPLILKPTRTAKDRYFYKSVQCEKKKWTVDN